MSFLKPVIHLITHYVVGAEEKMMKFNQLYIGFDNYKFVGGPSSFMGNLKKYLDENNYATANSISSAKAIFFPIAYDLEELNRFKTMGGKVIQRLDGVYYPSKHGEKYLELNSTIKRIYHDYADYVVFQSDYSRKQCFAMLGEKDTSQYRIILNGADRSIFYPQNKSTVLGEKINFISTGNFRNADMLEPVIKALDRLKGKLNFQLHIVGPIVNEVLLHLSDRPYVINHGSKTLEETADLVRRADIFIYSHLNPPCPNSVVEAISCGVPVVGFDSGSMAELCYFNRDLLAPVLGELFQHYEDFDSEKLTEKIVSCINHYSKFKVKALASADLYGFNVCGTKYVEVFRNCL